MVEGARLAGAAPCATVDCKPATGSSAPLSPLGGVILPEQRNNCRVAGQHLAESQGRDSPARQRVRSHLAEGQGLDSLPRLHKQAVCPRRADARCGRAWGSRARSGAAHRWRRTTIEDHAVGQMPTLHRRRRILQLGKVEPLPPTTIQRNRCAMLQSLG